MLEKKVYINGEEVTEVKGFKIQYDSSGTPFIEDKDVPYINIKGELTFLKHKNYSAVEEIRLNNLKLSDVFSKEVIAELPKNAKITSFHPKRDANKHIVVVGGYAVELKNEKEVEAVSQKIMQGKLKTGAVND
jgi:predicted MPP superfamily phosphohydrolase